MICAMNFRTRLRQARKNKNLTQAQLAEYVGLTQGAIQSLESGRIKGTTYITKLAEILEVSAKWLEDGEDESLSVLQQELDKNKHIKMARIAKYQIPLLEWADFDSFKTTLLTSSSIDQIIARVREKKRMLTIFLHENEVSTRLGSIEVKNLEAMLPLYQHKWALFDGDIIIIDFNKDPVAGDCVIVQINNNITVRQYGFDGDKPILKPLNPQFPITTDNFQILGTVIQIIRKRE